MRVNVYWNNAGIGNLSENLSLHAALLIIEAIMKLGGEITSVINVEDD